MDEIDRLIQAGQTDSALHLIEEQRRNLPEADYHYRRMVALSYCGQYEEAYLLGRDLLLLTHSPHPHLEFCVARLAISTGRWFEGLEGLDHCRNYGFFGGRFLTAERPLWWGQPLAGRRLLLLSEGGLGDIVCFARFARDFERLGATVILAADPQVFPLLRSMNFSGVLIDPAAALKTDFDYWLPALSAPRQLKLLPEKIDRAPYLSCPQELVDEWRHRLAFDGLKVALIWRGASGFAEDGFRSFREEEFQPLVEGLRNARFYSLHPSETGLHDCSPWIQNPLQLAGFLSSMDMVVSVDTGPAHVSGALGVNTLLLNRLFGWFTFAYKAPPGQFAQSHWYSSMRVLQQQRLKQWREEILFVRELLSQWDKIP